MGSGGERREEPIRPLLTGEIGDGAMRVGVRFEERCGWPPWVHLLVWFVVLACFLPQGPVLGFLAGTAKASGLMRVHPVPFALGLGFPLLFYGLMGELRTRVTDKGLVLAWGAAEMIRKEFPFSDILHAKAVTYSPLKEFGGWGIRFGSGGKSAWNIRGNRAVRLELAGGKIFYLGSARPERIVEWIHVPERKKNS